jgi:protoporphyrinogen oxidase
MILILGAGLSGLSCSYHLGHERCLILEKNPHAFGHIHSEIRDGFTWDLGPHVSFTKHDYVKELFAANVDGDYDEHEVSTANHYRGHWIDHPAQSNLYQVPEPLRSRCVESFLASRDTAAAGNPPADYQQWLEAAFGEVFANTFPAAYTRKYWTVPPAEMTTGWVGGRVFNPKPEDVLEGARQRLDRQTHYIQKIRYPKKGGYESFARRMRTGADIRFGSEVSRIDLAGKQLWTTDGRNFRWSKLINTLPLPLFISLCEGVPATVREAAAELSCSSVLLVNASARHPTRRKEDWMYVYDEDKHSTRINCTERLTRGNAPEGCTGVQVEVYASRHRPLPGDPENIRAAVVMELIEMGLLDEGAPVDSHVKWCPWANVIFTHPTRPALDVIWSWLEGFGLAREANDLDPCTDWTQESGEATGELAMAGRFGQWKYFWTDDCVLRGRQLGKSL